MRGGNLEITATIYRNLALLRRKSSALLRRIVSDLASLKWTMRKAGRRVENPRYYKQKIVLPLSPLLETMLKLVARTPAADAVLSRSFIRRLEESLDENLRRYGT